MDICGVDVSGVPGTGELRAVRNIIRLDGEVPAGIGAAYDARFQTEHCFVSLEYRIYEATQETETALSGHCDFQIEPCEWPLSELSNVSCGSYADQFALRGSPVVLAAIEGKSVTLTFDPNRFAEGSLPDGLAQDLAAQGTPPDVHHRPLEGVWAQTMLHSGVKGVTSSTIGAGDFAWRTGPFSLD